MAKLGMNGPYVLDAKTIDTQVTSHKCGNYALGYKDDSDDKFVVCYVGRSDFDVNKRLKEWVGKTKRPIFKYIYSSSPKNAFEKECNNYHDFSPNDKYIHPDRPGNCGWKCPRCDIFDDYKK